MPRRAIGRDGSSAGGDGRCRLRPAEQTSPDTQLTGEVGRVGCSKAAPRASEDSPLR